MVSEVQLSGINFNEKNGWIRTKKSPLNGKTLCEYVEPSEESIAQGILELRQNAYIVEDLGLFTRSELLQRLANSIEASKEDFAKLVREETGKPLLLALGEVDTAVKFLRSIAGAAVFQSGIVIPSANKRKWVSSERRPYGLAVLIVSFNTPLPNYAWKFAPAWLAGNGIVMKPSEHTPLSARLFFDKCLEVGMPRESLGLVLGGAAAGKALVKQEFDLLSFTGSLSAGLSIQELSSKNVRKTILELGGSNPFIVFADGNIDRAVESVVQSAFSNSGQRCASGSRLYLERAVYEEFISKLKSRLMKLTFGIESQDEVGTVVDESALERYKAFLRLCEGEGKIWITEGELRHPDAYIAQPAIVEIDGDSFLFQEELFLPILRIAPFDDERQVVRYANASKYGLTAAVWTKSLERIDLFRRALKTGVVNFNGPTHGSEFQFPFGGTKSSGNGSKEVGLDSLDEYSFKQIVSIDFSN
jgi:aldehyde dehydrogenase (NAD+)